MAVNWESEIKINRVNGYWMTGGQGECAMRESDEVGRTAERATGQGIVREKETGVGVSEFGGFFSKPGQKVLTLCQRAFIIQA